MSPRPFGPGLWSVQKVSRECSRECPGHPFDTPGTLSGHFSDTPERGARKLATGSTGVQRYRCIPRSAANNLGEIPKNLGAPNLLFLKSFRVERTFWDSSLLVSLTLWDTPVLFTPPLPLPKKGPGDTPSDTPSNTPHFRGHSRDTPGMLRARRA